MDINKIIHLYKMFPKYQDNTYHEIYNHVIPSIQLNQFKIFEDEDGVYGFVNWVYLNKDTETKYKNKAQIYKNEWNCGVNLWIHDIVSVRKTKEVALWTVKYCLKKIKINDFFSWIRVNDQNQIVRISKKYKREFHN